MLLSYEIGKPPPHSPIHIQLCIEKLRYHVSVFLQYFLVPSVKLPSNNL